MNIINYIRKVKGWGALTATDMNAQIQIWFEQFSRFRIPQDAYKPLLNRAIDRRQEYLTAGKQLPELDAELLISCWDAIKDNFRPKELAVRAQSGCSECFGTGMTRVMRDGRQIGVRTGCECLGG